MRIWSKVVAIWTGILLYTGLKSSDASAYTNNSKSVSIESGLSQDTITSFLFNNIENDTTTSKRDQRSRQDDIYEKKYFDVLETEERNSWGPFTDKPSEVLILKIPTDDVKRSGRSLNHEYSIDKRDTLTFFPRNARQFEMNIRDFINVKHNEKVTDINYWTNFMIERIQVIKKMPKAKVLFKKMSKKLNVARSDSDKTISKILRVNDFIVSNSKKYKAQEEDQSVTENDNNVCEFESGNYIIKEYSIICHSDSFYKAFDRIQLFNFEFNEKYSKTDELTRQISAVILMLRDEIEGNRKLRNHLMNKNYRNLRKILNTLYESIYDIELFETLYNVYSPFSQKSNLNSSDYKTVVVRFFDYIMLNLNYLENDIDFHDVTLLLSHLEKRRLIYDLGYPSVEIEEKKYGLYVHIVLSFIASFGN